MKHAVNFRLSEKAFNSLFLLEKELYLSKTAIVENALLKKQGSIIADLDLMIASITLCNESVLVTNNTKHFSRIKKLKIENWAV